MQVRLVQERGDEEAHWRSAERSASAAEFTTHRRHHHHHSAAIIFAYSQVEQMAGIQSTNATCTGTVSYGASGGGREYLDTVAASIMRKNERVNCVGG